MSKQSGKTGYKNPPNHSRFKPGQSGNPKGRPKGTKNLATDLREELSSRIPVKEDGMERRISKQRALIKTLSAKALKGDMQAIKTLVSLLERVFRNEPSEPQERTQSAGDHAIVEAYLSRHGVNPRTRKQEQNDD